jgi:ketosteroid isomerase-like protein
MSRAALTVLLALAWPAGAWAASPRDPGAAGVAAFNAAFDQANRRMDNAAVLALWEPDGVSLMPNAAPIEGRAGIEALLRRVTADHPKAHMESFALRCAGLQVAGSWASEWCFEHQVVVELGQPTFDGWGKMLLVLHRDPQAGWRLSREMWNQAQAGDWPKD